MSYFDDEGTIMKLKRTIAKLRNALNMFADEKSWYTDYEDYSVMWTRTANPSTLAKKALEEDPEE